MSSTLTPFALILPPHLLTLLRIAPLLSTTASLTHAYMEYITVSSFLHPAPTNTPLSRFLLQAYEPTTAPTNTAAVLHAKEVAAPVWFVNFFQRGVWSVIGLNSITLLTTSANLWLYSEDLGDARAYYLTGLVAAAAHYAFVPLVGDSVARLYRLCAAGERGEDDEVKKGASAVESVREWVGWHTVRMCSVDVVAWSAFVVCVSMSVGSK